MTADEIISTRLADLASGIKEEKYADVDLTEKIKEHSAEKKESKTEKSGNTNEEPQSFGFKEFSTTDTETEEPKKPEIKHEEDDPFSSEKEESLGKKVAYADREKEKASQYRDAMPSVRQKMEDIGLSKDSAIDLILQLTDTGYIEESFSLLGGRVKGVLRSPKMKDSASFVDVFDETDMNTQAKVEFYLALFSAAAVLHSYGDNLLGEMSIKERTKWIEENIPTVIYKVMLPSIQKFNEQIELLSSQEVSDFF